MLYFNMKMITKQKGSFMKNILLVLVLLFSLNSPVFAEETPINVIYVHGSNQVNLGGVDGFATWINRMHPNLKKNFEKNDFIKSHLLSNAYISDKPEMLYWGNMLKNNKSLVDSGLEKSKKKSNKFSQFTRGLIGQVVHDAVWLQKNKNMTPILNELNDKVLANYKNGEKTMLVGYSAGTFITLNYLLMRNPIINMNNLFEEFNGQYNITKKDKELVSKYTKQNTCISAALRSKLFVMNNEGVLSINPNQKEREAALKQIDNLTALSCAPDDAISGVLNFGSPIVVFYSEFSDENHLYKYLIAKMMQDIVETDKFYLTVNYSKDPIAVPIPNFTYDKLLNNENCKGIKKGNGFIYDTIVSGGGITAEGHTQYWYTTNAYTKAVAKSYAKGYEYFYKN